MNKLKFFGLLALLVLSVTVLSAQEVQPVITLERTACFGSCPMYTVSIYEDGTVRYNGDKFVTVTGEQTTQIDPATVTAMVEAIADAGYFEWAEAYDTMTVTDHPSVITSVTRNGETHQISRYTGDFSAPVALAFVEQWIDTMANTGLWTGVQPMPFVNPNGDVTPLITLEQTACFGPCPVYSVALYEDGTVVYSGIANVEMFGVHVLKIDPLEITAVAQRAEALGYFGWNDSYEQQVMTDQVTVITTIRGSEAFKRIVRYNGDSNAPVGLVWIEDSINQTVVNSTEAE